MLQIVVVSRKDMLWSGLGTQVIVPAAQGSLGILPQRQPLLSTLQPGTVKVFTEDGDTVSFDVDSGFASVDSDFVTIVVGKGTVHG